MSNEHNAPAVPDDILARACNLAGLPYETFLKIKSYLPTAQAGTFQEPAVPQGWRLVPIEPTKEMLDAGLKRKAQARWIDGASVLRARTENLRPAEEIAALQWGAMLAATPATPSQEPVMWQYRSWFAENTGTPGWSEWAEVKARNAYTGTVMDSVRELQHYIAQGYKYEIRALYVATPAPAPAVPSVQQGWVEQMLTDARHVFDAGGAETPQETRDVIEYVASWIAAYRDNLAATQAPAPVVAGTRIESGVMIMKDGKAWGVAYSDGQTTAYGWVTPEQATIHDPKHLVKPTDATWQGSGYADELRKGKIVHVERRTQVIVKEQP